MKKIEYREQALKILPWVCGKCGRDFTGKKLRELTVHHKDHNFRNNPPDGSNWELLCIYCHDNEHQKRNEVDQGNTGTNGKLAHATHNPFAESWVDSANGTDTDFPIQNLPFGRFRRHRERGNSVRRVGNWFRHRWMGCHARRESRHYLRHGDGNVLPDCSDKISEYSY